MRRIVQSQPSTRAASAVPADVYNADGSATVNDALGNTHGYDFTTSNNIVLPTAVTGVPVANIGAKVITYDQYERVASRTDFNGNITTYTHTARGQETSRTEKAAHGWRVPSRPPGIQLKPADTDYGVSYVPGVNRVTTFDYDNANGALLRKPFRRAAKAASDVCQ